MFAKFGVYIDWTIDNLSNSKKDKSTLYLPLVVRSRATSNYNYNWWRLLLTIKLRKANILHMCSLMAVKKLKFKFIGVELNSKQTVSRGFNTYQLMAVHIYQPYLTEMFNGFH